MSKFFKSLNISLTTRFHNLKFDVTQSFIHIMFSIIYRCKLDKLSSKTYIFARKAYFDGTIYMQDISKSRVMMENT